MNDIRNNRGQMLLEALIAISIFMIALVVITVTVITAVANSRFTQDQNSANKYAQEGIENVRVVGYGRIKRITGTISMGDNGRLNDPPLVDTVNVDGKFKRYITFTQNGGPCTSGTRIEVVVSWSSSKCTTGNTFCHESRQSTCLTPAGI